MTGCGDGGLIDTLRLLIDQFDHGEFLKDFIALPALKDIKPELLRIESEAKVIQDAKQSHEYMLYEYPQLPLPDAITKQLEPRIDRKVSVTLNGTGLGPLESKASILSRYLIFLMLQVGALEYLEGQIKSVEPDSKGGGKVQFELPSGQMEAAYHEIVVRHGPEPVVHRLFPEGALQSLKLTAECQNEMTKTKQWGDFFPTIGEHPAKLIHSKEYLSEHLNEAIAALSVGNQTTSIGIAADEATGELIYVVTCLAKEDPAVIAASLPKQVANVPVRVKAIADSQIPAGKRRIDAPYAFSKSLVCGISIVNDRLYGGPRGFESIGSVGCFVRLGDGGVAVLTTSHTLVGGSGGGKAGDPVSSPEYSEEFYVGRVYSYTEFGIGQLVSLGPGISYCKADAALAKLDRGVPYSPDFDPALQATLTAFTENLRHRRTAYQAGRVQSWSDDGDHVRQDFCCRCIHCCEICVGKCCLQRGISSRQRGNQGFFRSRRFWRCDRWVGWVGDRSADC